MNASSSSSSSFSTAVASTNTLSAYGEKFLPPKYCTREEYQIWKSSTCSPFLSHEERVSSCNRIEEEEETTLSRRLTTFASAQQHYYRRPPMIERGYKQFLYDIDGRAYLGR